MADPQTALLADGGIRDVRCAAATIGSARGGLQVSGGADGRHDQEVEGKGEGEVGGVMEGKEGGSGR